MRKRLVLPMVILMVISLVPAVGQAEEQPEEFRAIWVDAFHDGIKTPEQVDKLVQDVREANANAVVVQVRRRGDSYFNKSLEPRSQDPALESDFDALEYLIEKAHQADIEVHAWLTTLPIWNSLYPPESEEHAFNQHGPSASGEDYWLTESISGDNRSGADYILDPGHPDAADYTADQYVNVVKEYDVDGVHLDLVRYTDPTWGYNPTSVDRYLTQTGTEDVPEPENPQWKDWRRQQVNNLVRQVYLRSIAEDPGVKVSAAVIAWGKGPETMEEYKQSAPYSTVLQDWNGWLEEGIVDLAIPMNYDREHVPLQKAWYDLWIEWEKDHQYDRQVAAGPGSFINTIEGTLAQINRALQPSAEGNRLAGVSLYSYASTNNSGIENDTFFQALSEESEYGEPVFSEPAAIPDMPWKTNPTKGHLMGYLMDEDGDPVDNGKVVLRGSKGKTYQFETDGNGFFGLTDLPDGHYVAQIDGETGEGSSKPLDIEAGVVTETELQVKAVPQSSN
ncbi:Uncharacterized lipoprotein YddW, UPF0748 family [Virgibacillus subterraneus]|uniref:Uncharacterized lipoprotein YddW, UPF0748 family n=1 Tax=Virgibacillus subterraneus TaxID=621109 RepID=A0A1H8ZI87_9BACI|nr:family 10 glycosylhydrolase [Virgibacillus subterraneus]SEP64132.1 Uncharacterized lipoprotein YddW, UPF0748 family [Virgibacillus subterraneus]